MTLNKHSENFSCDRFEIGGMKETVVERADYPPEKVHADPGKRDVAVLGYGVQGRGQSLNMRDNGVKVIVGQRERRQTYDLAVEDGWVPGETLFDSRKPRRAARSSSTCFPTPARKNCGRRSNRS